MKKVLVCCAIILAAGGRAYCDESPQEGDNAAPSVVDMSLQTKEMQQKMASDPEIMQIVAGLMFDPQFQELMKDPEIVAAVRSQNVQALLRNEKFLGLMNNQKLQEIMEKVKSAPQ